MVFFSVVVVVVRRRLRRRRRHHISENQNLKNRKLKRKRKQKRKRGNLRGGARSALPVGRFTRFVSVFVVVLIFGFSNCDFRNIF